MITEADYAAKMHEQNGVLDTRFPIPRTSKSFSGGAVDDGETSTPGRA